MVGVDTIEPLPESLAGFDHLHRLVFSGQSKANCTLFGENASHGSGKDLVFRQLLPEMGLILQLKRIRDEFRYISCVCMGGRECRDNRIS